MARNQNHLRLPTGRSGNASVTSLSLVPLRFSLTQYVGVGVGNLASCSADFHADGMRTFLLGVTERQVGGAYEKCLGQPEGVELAVGGADIDHPVGHRW
jgi:hypothetical protein